MNSEEIVKRRMDGVYTFTLRKLIDYSFDTQHAFKHRQNMDKVAYIREYCTIKVQGPRRSGHSQAVSDLARLYDAWIVTPTVALGDLNHKEWKKRCSVRSLDRTRGNSARVVICDSVSELTDEQITLLHAMSWDTDGPRGFVLVYLG